MRTIRIVGLCLAVTMTAGSIEASAQQMKRPNVTDSPAGVETPNVTDSPAGVKKPNVTDSPAGVQPTVKALTVSECWGLGGEVLNASRCGTGGQACKTVNQEGKEFYQCITKK